MADLRHKETFLDHLDGQLGKEGFFSCIRALYVPISEHALVSLDANEPDIWIQRYLLLAKRCNALRYLELDFRTYALNGQDDYAVEDTIKRLDLLSVISCLP
jgi:hypothetical protein